MELDRVEMIVTPRFEQTGSIARGDASSRLLDVDTRLVLESSAEAAVVAEVVGAAERTCFLMDAIRNPRDVDARSTRTSSVTDSETPRAGRTRALPPLRVVGDGGEGCRRCARVVSEKARGRENETRMTGTEIAEAGRSRALRVADAPGEGFAR